MTGRRFWADLGERVAFTALEAFAATFVVGAVSDLGDVDVWQRALVAAVAASLAAVKGFAAQRVGDPGSAAMLPADT